MIIHYLALPIAAIFAVLVIRDLINNNKTHLKGRIAVIAVCLAAYWVSGLAIDWIKDEYAKSRPNYVSTDKTTGTSIQKKQLK